MIDPTMEEEKEEEEETAIEHDTMLVLAKALLGPLPDYSTQRVPSIATPKFSLHSPREQQPTTEKQFHHT